MIRSQQTKKTIFISSVILSALLISGCAAEDTPPDLPTVPTESPTVTTEPTEPQETEEEPDTWQTLSAEERCTIIVGQLQGSNIENQVPIEDLLLRDVLFGALEPDCVIAQPHSGSLPTQLSIYSDGYVGLKDEVVAALGEIDFYPWDDSATLANLQSLEAPGDIVVEHWEAEALLEYSDDVRQLDLTEVVIVLVTANYDPDFDPDMETQ